MTSNELQKDDVWLARRRREMQPYLDYFGQQLFNVVAIMPAPKRIFHFATGEWEIVNDPKWQQLIDKIKDERDKYLQTEFPEFFNQLPPSNSNQ